MNRVLKKFIPLVLAVFLMLSLFAACDNNGKSTDTTATVKPETATSAPQEASQEPTPTEKEMVSFTWVWKDRNAASEGDEAVRQYINDKFNVDFKTVFIPGSDLETKLSVMLAAGEDIDCTYGWLDSPGKATDFQTLRASGQIQPLTNYLDAVGQDLLADVDAYAWGFTKDENGDIWFIPDEGFGSKNFLFVRADWMEKFNIAAPVTIEEFENMLITFRDGDPDGNGKNDTYPMIGEKMAVYRDCFMASYLEHGYSWFEQDGQLVPFFMDPNFKAYMAKMAEWYQTGLIHPDQIIASSAQVVDIASSGVSGVFPNYYSLSYQNQIREAFPGADMTYISFPVGPSGQSGSMTRSLFSGGLVIMAKTPPVTAERIVEIVNWTQTPEGTNFNWYGIEGVHWVKNGDKIEPAPGVDPEKPAYNAELLINGGNAWKYFTESSLVSPPIMSETRQAALSGKYPSIDPVDFMFLYHWNGTKTEPLYKDLDSTMPAEMFVKIMSGEEPVEWLDTWIEEWMNSGGLTYIQERSEQYFALKPIYGAN